MEEHFTFLNEPDCAVTSLSAFLCFDLLVCVSREFCLVQQVRTPNKIIGMIRYSNKVNLHLVEMKLKRAEVS